MNLDKSIIDSIHETNLEIIETASSVNKLSYSRKQITSETIMLVSELIEKNSEIITNYKQVFKSLQNYIFKIHADINTFKNNSVFREIMENSKTFTNELNEISHISTDVEKISNLILDESLNLDTLLNDLGNYLNKLTGIVKEPIEGSGKNIQRGKFLEEKSKEIKRMFLQ